MDSQDPSAPAARSAASMDWPIRILLAIVPVMFLVLAVVAIPRYPVSGSLGTLVAGYFVLGLLAPSVLMRLMRGIGAATRRPYEAVARPISAATRRLYRSFLGPKVIRPVDALIVGTGRLIEGLVKLALKLGLWLVGIGLALGLGVLIFSGVTKLPVSVAVILGALIIAGALGSRR